MGRRMTVATGVVVAVMFVWGVGAAAPVPDTGQTQCYDGDGNEFPCPNPGEPFYGQDGNYSINPPSYSKMDGESFTKLDETGIPLPDSAPDWSMVRDKVTGLIWEVKTDDGGIHDRDDGYDWYDAQDEFIAALNNAGFGGYSDWRMPTIEELAYLVDYSIPDPGPTINTSYFPNTLSSYYWSSTSYAGVPDDAWGIRFDRGYNWSNYKSSGYYVRAVRGGQSDVSSFVDNGNGTVSDTSTGLMWQQETVEVLNWEDALAYCESLDLGGHTDWRLPTIKELCSLVDHTIYDPAIDKDFFPDTMSSNYWSSTSGAYFPDGAWGISFYYGYNIGLLKSYDSYVRAVRGGQSGPFVNLNIRANGSDGPVDVPVGQTVRVTVSVDPCGHAGEQAEWWVAANTPFDPPADWFSYVLSDIWTPGILRCAVAPLFDLAPFEVLNMALPLGGYTFYFVLDDTVDGVPELEWMDSVEVNVVE